MPAALITTQVFPPEPAPSGVMAQQLSRALAAAGWKVTVAAGFPHHPRGRLYPGYHLAPFRHETDGDVQIWRAAHLVSPRPQLSVRALVQGTQALSAALAGALTSRPDVIINYGPTFAGPLLSAAVARLHGAKLVSLIYDIYPDVAIETGHLRNPALIALARALERQTYLRSDKLVVLSEGFRAQLAARDVAEEKLEVIPVWLDGDDLAPQPRDNAWRKAQGIEASTLVVLYAGTIGVVSGAEIVLEVAAELKNDPRVLFLFVGEGRLRPQLEAQATERHLGNVRFLPFVEAAELAAMQATADISLVTLAPGRGRTSVPSKVVGYMAAARPVIASVDLDCDTARLIDRTHAGVVVPPGAVAPFVGALRRLLDDPGERSRLGAAGRAAFDAEFAKDAVLRRFVTMLDTLARPH